MTAKELKNAILQLAVQGKLVPQNPDDEPASELLKRIQAEKARLAKEGKVKKDKPLPPISEDEKPFEIPDSWEWVRLRDVALIERGAGIKRAETSPTGVPCVRYGEIYTTYGYTFTVTQSFVPKSVASFCHLANPGDVLCTLTGEWKEEIAKATAYLGTGPIAIGGDLAKISSTAFHPVLLVYFFFSPFMIQQKADNANGTMIVHIGKDAIGNLLIPLPPLAEQKRIVSKIEELMPLLEEFGKKEERLSALDVEFPDALRKSILQQAIQGKLTKRDPADEPASELLKRIRAEKAKLLKSGKNRIKKPLPPITEDEMPFEIPVGWLAVRIGDIGIYKKGPFGSSITKNMFVPKGPDAVKVYEQKNAIQKNHSIGDYYIRKSYFEEKLRGFEVFPGDVIVSCAGTIGETYVMPDGIERGIINQALMRMKIVPSLNLDYFLLYFDYILKKTAQRSSKGSAIKNIPPFEIFKKMVLPLPPLAEQQRIVERVNELIAMCDELKAVSNRMES